MICGVVCGAVKMMPKLTWRQEGGGDARNMNAGREAPGTVPS